MPVRVFLAAWLTLEMLKEMLWLSLGTTGKRLTQIDCFELKNGKEIR